MKKAKGYALLSALDALDDQTVAEALSERDTKATVLRPKKRFNMSAFFEHPAVVAAVCALVALGTVTGIIMAGQFAGETAVSAESEEATLDIPKTEIIYVLTDQTDRHGDGENLPVKTAYEYDEMGRLTKETVTHSSPKEVQTTEYTYDGQGRLILERYFNKAVASDSENGYYGAKRYVYKDTPDGLMVTRTYFNESGKARTVSTERYDLQGRLVYSATVSQISSDSEIVTFTYTEDGYVKNTISHDVI